MQIDIFNPETASQASNSVYTTKHYFGEVKAVYKSHRKKPKSLEKLSNSFAMSKFLRSIWSKDIQIRERTFAVYLNNAMQAIGHSEIGSGGVTACVVDPKLVFQHALLVPGVSGLVLAHCHPSGNLNPSESDNKLTKTISEAGKVLELKLLDHIILTESSYFSYADEGRL